ncbi:sensor histidine kinase [Methylobacterium goesingense]|uniref:Signal transduction histidine kinase n=1 Tax=Methylobacterium goesingense TaxID=243690 RepID=A0ABV2L587_9HYPH|nr:sensor histidine kinase [Methylobacterium goesingense]GJD74018.1 hypothetical protein CFIICLFH_2251 [Methylobacterium goesingense]
MLVVDQGGLVVAANAAARGTVGGVRPDDVLPIHGTRRVGFLRYLKRCASTDAIVPGTLFLEADDGTVERRRCHGARTRFDAFGGRVLTLLHLDGPMLDRRFAILSAKLEAARGVMQERRLRSRRMQSLLEERGRLLVRLKEDAAARVAAERERDQVLTRLYRAGQDERRRLARDLHDHAGQHLVAMTFGLRRLTPHLAAPGALAELDLLLRQAQDIGQALRRVSLELRPAALDEFGFVTALRYLAKEWSRLTGIATEFQMVGQDVPLSTELAVTLYRLSQEALTNVAKHAGQPSAVSVVLLFGVSHLTLTVDDDGVGFDADAASALALVAEGKLGLIGMRERMSLVGGSLELESMPGHGTTVMARVHLRGDVSSDG